MTRNDRPRPPSRIKTWVWFAGVSLVLVTYWMRHHLLKQRKDVDEDSRIR